MAVPRTGEKDLATEAQRVDRERKDKSAPLKDARVRHPAKERRMQGLDVAALRG
jgi:hypothetical protein